jgi:hypothetical protein
VATGHTGGRSYAPEQAAKAALFAAGTDAGCRKNRQETNFFQLTWHHP